jgi:hypothetical protein
MKPSDGLAGRSLFCTAPQTIEELWKMTFVWQRAVFGIVMLGIAILIVMQAHQRGQMLEEAYGHQESQQSTAEARSTIRE